MVHDKGSDIKETWLDSGVTVAHCLGWKLGNTMDVQSSVDQPFAGLTDFFASSETDDCSCGCSSSGCLFLHAFCKGMAKPLWPLGDYDDGELKAEKRRLMEDWPEHCHGAANWIRKAIQGPEQRLLVSEFIRFVIFTKFDLTHTCCDIGRIQHPGDIFVYEPTISPTPRYNPKRIQRILQDDEYLLSVLESLLEDLDDLYDVLNQPLNVFFRSSVMPTIDEKLEELRSEDDKMYARGRFEMGVRMDVPIRETDPYETDGSDEEAQSEGELDSVDEDS